MILRGLNCWVFIIFGYRCYVNYEICCLCCVCGLHLLRMLCCVYVLSMLSFCICGFILLLLLIVGLYEFEGNDRLILLQSSPDVVESSYSGVLSSLFFGLNCLVCLFMLLVVVG